MTAIRPRAHPLILLLVAWTAACGDGVGRGDSAGPAGARDPARYGGTVVIANNSDVEHMNALVAVDRYTQEINRYLLFLPLLRYSAGLDYEAALAERWELLGDTGVVFHLRRDVYWHDGVQTTARDVLFTFERAKDPETAFPNASYLQHWTGAEAVDTFTVRFSFVPHLDPLAGAPFLPIMPAHLLDSIPPARLRQAAFNRRPVGNGPFRFVEYRTNDRTVFAANADFPEGLGGRPYIDRVVYRPIPDGTAQIAELIAGTADITLTPPTQEFDRLAQQRGIRALQRPGRQYANVMWNGRLEPLDDPAVRRGLTYAIDRDRILEVLQHGYGEIAVGPIAPYHWAFDSSVRPLPFSPDSARALFAAAGLLDRDGDGVLELPDGRPFQVEIKVPAGATMSRDMAELIRSDLAAVGVRITTRAVDMSTLFQDVSSPNRNFEAFILGWQSDFRINLRDTFHSDAYDGQFQVASYRNPQVDLLIDSVSRVLHRTDAAPIYAELQRLLRDDQPWSFLYYYPDMVLMRDRLQGVEMDIRGALTGITRWWIAGPTGAQLPDDSAGHVRDPDPAQRQ